MEFADLIRLEPHGPDVLVGSGPGYPWGGLYGGQIVAQALAAASATVEDGFAPHSLRAYFIRAGDAREPVRYEVDRIRNGSSFCTRRVVARQAIGAILNLEASFHTGEESMEVSSAALPADLAGPDGLENTSCTTTFERRYLPGGGPDGLLRSWFRMRDAVGDAPHAHAAALAFISDDLPTEVVFRAMGIGPEAYEEGWFSVSLDHTIWFHRPIDTDEWHLQEFTSQVFTRGRGLAIGRAYGADGTHVATIAQEVLIRRRRG